MDGTPRLLTSRTGVVGWTPVAVATLFSVLFWIRPRNPIGLGEYGPVELLTFSAFLTAGLWGLSLIATRARVRSDRLRLVCFVVLGSGLVFAGMEEISWGQWFLHFSTPGAFQANAQGELTLHNMPGVHGQSEYLGMAFGIVGLAGLGIGRMRRLALLAPPRALLAWFVVILALSALDQFADDHPIGVRPGRVLDSLAEVVEMLVGMAAVLYVWGCAGRLRTDLPDASVS